MEKVIKAHAVLARSKFRSQNLKKHLMFGPLLQVEMPKKCTPLWREAHFQVKSVKADGFGPLLGGCRFAWQAQGIVHLVKREQNVQVFWHVQKRWQGRGTFEEDPERWIFRGRRNTRDMFIRDVRRSGR